MTPDEADPPYVPDRELFGAHTHQELWDHVHEALDPGALGQAADAWHRNAELVGEAFRAFSDSTDAEFARWSGQARDAALRATRALVARGTAMSEVCAAVHRLLESDAEAAQAIRDAIPPPPPPYQPLEDPVAEAVHGGRRRMEYDLRAASALADARDVMAYVYNPTMPASGDRVPRFAPAPPGPGSSGGHQQ
ncbi:hypothetical protein [Nocardia wallacei]|uniref:PPE family domain-containing protein n=1 Tax=Nocardia wallacei TaxID=480035 RepID=A0A7G1KXZ0_9NOCA|nr:hypothetical protein [Nocardia wallacei]BCK58859.1 hypothetical protein NWFMUON74_66310 [Nocardia wallacei]